MTINLIAAIGPKNIIGYRGKLPWSLPEDLKRFRKLTMGHPVIMGRKTYESIGRPLPKRTNIIITRQKEYKAHGCIVVHSYKAALAQCGDQDVFIIGGAEIYKQALPRADFLYLTEVKLPVKGDVYFPKFDRQNTWQEIEREAHDQFDFVILQKRK